MLALPTARPSLNSSTPLSIVVLLALLACTPLIGMSQASAVSVSASPVPDSYVTEINEGPGQMEEPPTELTQTSNGNLHPSKSLWDCYDIKTPFGVTFADGSELTVEWGLEEAQDKMQAEHPGKTMNGFVYPLTIEYIDGTSELIISAEMMAERTISCFEAQ